MSLAVGNCRCSRSCELVVGTSPAFDVRHVHHAVCPNAAGCSCLQSRSSEVQPARQHMHNVQQMSPSAAAGSGPYMC